MSAPMTPAQWKKQLLKFDVPVEYLDGWETRGRPPSKGPFSDVHGIVIHHTGGNLHTDASYTKFLFITGRSDLPAPLCHAEGRADGTIVMGAAKRANHAGLGNSKSLEHVLNETTPYDKELKPTRFDNSVDGNRHFYGIEIDYGRSYDGPTSNQIDSGIKWAAAICDWHGWTGASIIGHREWTYTKSDPARIKMFEFRQAVNDLIAEVNGALTEPEEPIVTPPPSAIKYPSDLLPLNIAKLTLPIGPSESPIEVKQPRLDNFEHRLFRIETYKNKPLVIFECPTKGTTTKGSEYTRTEIREMKPDGKTLASWDCRDFHQCLYEGVVFEKHKQTVLQIHDHLDDVLMITVKNNLILAEYSKGKGKGTVPYILDNKYVLGTKFYLNVTTGELVYLSGKKGILVRYQRSGSPSIVAVWREVKATVKCYWKYGVYNQVKTGRAGNVGVFSVKFND